MKQLLIIEDDSTFAASLVRSMSRRGYTCSIASSIQESKEILSKQSPDCVLLDLNLGLECTQPFVPELRAKAPNSSIVILTGHGSIPSAVAAIKDGADAYLTKPATPEAIDKALLEKIHKPKDEIKLWDLEQDYISKTLNECNGNISEAARKLGLHRRTLQRRLKKT